MTGMLDVAARFFSVPEESVTNLHFVALMTSNYEYHTLYDFDPTFASYYLRFWKTLERNTRMRQVWLHIALFCVIAGHHQFIHSRTLFSALMWSGVFGTYAEFKRSGLTNADFNDLVQGDRQFPLPSLFLLPYHDCLKVTPWKEAFQAQFNDGEGEDAACLRFVKALLKVKYKLDEKRFLRRRDMMMDVVQEAFLTYRGAFEQAIPIHPPLCTISQIRRWNKGSE